MKPKKLIREKLTEVIDSNKIEYIKDQDILNELYKLKILEELQEVEDSNYKDIEEFADLLTVVLCFAEQNGIVPLQLADKVLEKEKEKGDFSNVVLNDLNPNNPSNDFYFKK